MLEKDMVKAIFDHIRNLFYCTLIFAAGFYVNLNPPDWVGGTFLAQTSGYLIIVIGFILLALIISGGIYKISKLRHPIFLSITLIVFYIIIAVRLILITVEFRMR